MLIVGILFGLVVAAFLAIILHAVIRGQPKSDASLDCPGRYGPFGGPGYSNSLIIRTAAQNLDPLGRPADWIHPAEAADIVAHKRRRIGD